MQLYFIRHGQSENNLRWKLTGSPVGRSEDAELTRAGHEQAEHVARFTGQASSSEAAQGWDSQNTAGFGITHLYCSLMVRAVATGAKLARSLHIPLVAWSDLHEETGIYQKDQGTEELIGLPGKNRAYFEAHYPDLALPETLGQAGWWNRPPEEPEQCVARARRVARELLVRHGGTDHRVAVVSHGAFYNRLMAILFDLSDRLAYRFVINNCAITRVDFEGEQARLMYANRADFLPRMLITH